MQTSSYKIRYNDKESLTGYGGPYVYGFRMFDTEVAWFLSVDPLAKKYLELPPYQFGSNRPIDGTDSDGWEYSPFCALGTEMAKLKLATLQMIQKINNIHDVSDEQEVTQYNRPYVQGALGVVGGLGQIGIGSSLLTSEPTTLAKVSGSYQIVQRFAGVGYSIAKIADEYERDTKAQQQSTRIIVGGLTCQKSKSSGIKKESDYFLQLKELHFCSVLEMLLSVNLLRKICLVYLMFIKKTTNVN